jgi:hypothetical protein
MTSPELSHIKSLYYRFLGDLKYEELYEKMEELK